MADLERLTHRPIPTYTMAQASSYDRASVKPGDDSWYANNDAGNYLRVEERYDRKEYVMADMKGPGAVVRMWSANPSGVVRFYFDGEELPRIQIPLAALLAGVVAPFRGTFAYEAGNGHDLYFPIPYEKSLKITIDDSDKAHPPTSLYYHIGYRSYEAGTKVETFDPRILMADDIDAAANALENPSVQPPPLGSVTKTSDYTVAPASTSTFSLDGESAVYSFTVKVDLPTVAAGAAWTDPTEAHNILRSLLLMVSFDSELCVATPLGDFFGTAPGVNPYVGVPFSVSDDGTMTCRFVMPFHHDAKYSIQNVGPIPVTLHVTAKTMPYHFTRDSYYFHAQWTAERKPPRPFREITLLDAKGEGYWIGDNLHIANPAREWWGEGDEKAFVDGESFPSTFGTGSEDFYGYAWGSTKTFMRPYHGQPNSGSQTDNFGHTDVHRWQIFDPIPFRSSINFTIEAWSWNKTLEPTFAHTSYWYQSPHGTAPITMDQSLLLPPELTPPTGN